MTVSEDGAVVPIETVINDRFRDLLEDIVLGRSIREDSVEGEGVIIFSIGQLVPGDLQFQRIISERKVRQGLIAGLKWFEASEDLKVFLDHTNEFI